MLRKALIEVPVLAYPNFTKSFRLETDACVKGLGAVLSQLQGDGKVHPVAYASRALSDPEKCYAVTTGDFGCCLGVKPFSYLPEW